MDGQALGANFKFDSGQFTVQEIMPDGTVLEPGGDYDFSHLYQGVDPQRLKFTHFVLQKRDWNTTDALAALGRRLGVSYKRFDFAGTKDRKSTSVQLASVFGVDPQRVMGAMVKDLQVLGAWKAPDKVRLGSLLGNRFRVGLTEGNCGMRVNARELAAKAAQGRGYFVPNFFGVQRFGSLRSNTARMGRLMLAGEFEQAVWDYLVTTSANENGDAVAARNRLGQERDFSKALSFFPRRLGFERRMLGRLSQNPADFVGALRSLPRTLNLLFLHAFQSEVFNVSLQERVACGTFKTPQEGDLLVPIGNGGFPALVDAAQVGDLGAAQASVREGLAVLAARLVGPEVPLTGLQGEILKRYGLAPQAFEMRGMPELSCKSVCRCNFVPLLGFECSETGAGEALVQFSLPSGSYATVALSSLIGWPEGRQLTEVSA